MSTFTTATITTGATPVLTHAHRHGPLRFQDYPDGIVEVAYPINYEELYNLKGRLLTLVDATFSDPEQRRAHKNLVWQTLQSWMSDTVECVEHAEPVITNAE